MYYGSTLWNPCYIFKMREVELDKPKKEVAFKYNKKDEGDLNLDDVEVKLVR